MSTYTHENVPEEIAKKFPHLQGKKFISKEQVPVHVIESAEKNSKPVVVKHNATNQAPAVVGQKATLSHPAALHKSVVHHTATKSPVIAHHNKAVPTATITKEVPVQGQIHVLGKDHDATATKVSVPHVVHKAPVPHLIGQSQVKVGAPIAPKAAFTHENVPEEVHKKFPHLQNKATIKVGVNGHHTTIKSPEKVGQPKINVVHASEHQKEQN